MSGPDTAPEREPVVAGAARPAAGTAEGSGRARPSADVDAGQLQIGTDDTGRITLDLPSEHRSPQVWTQIIEAVQRSGRVPTQRQLAAELNVPRSRVRRAIERHRDAWDELCDSVGERADSSPVG